MRETLRAWARYYLPVALWLALILGFSTGSFSSETTGGAIERLLALMWPGLLHRLSESELFWLNAGARKLAHLVEYAVLALLVCRAGTRGQSPLRRRHVVAALAVAAATAVVDEAHQGLYANRTSTGRDVVVDICGALLGLAGRRQWERIRAKCRTSGFPN